MRFIDLFNYNDYDRVVRFLHEQNIPIIARDKVKMEIVADISPEIEKQIYNLPFEEYASIGAHSVNSTEIKSP